jgi:hypothetical protein
MTEQEDAKALFDANQKDLEERVRGFNGEMIPLLSKYKLGIGARLNMNVGSITPEIFFANDDKPKAPAETKDKLEAAE